MLKRRSTWLGGTGAMLLVLSLSGVVAAATAFTAASGPAPAAEPLPAVDTTATFVDIDGNGIDDTCQTEPAVAADQTVIDAEIATVDLNADGVISTTEAAHSPRIGGANCNHGGYVSWIAQHKHDCVVAPTDPTVQPVDATVTTAEETDETETPEATEPDADAADAGACDADTASITGAKKDKVAAAAARAASKAERTLARETAKAERTAARQASKAERTAARDAAKAARQAAHAAKAKHHSH